jgi:hypothetical protein
MKLSESGRVVPPESDPAVTIVLVEPDATASKTTTLEVETAVTVFLDRCHDQSSESLCDDFSSFYEVALVLKRTQFTAWEPGLVIVQLTAQVLTHLEVKG